MEYALIEQDINTKTHRYNLSKKSSSSQQSKLIFSITNRKKVCGRCIPTNYKNTIIPITIIITWVFLSIIIHELGHVIALIIYKKEIYEIGFFYIKSSKLRNIGEIILIEISGSLFSFSFNIIIAILSYIKKNYQFYLASFISLGLEIVYWLELNGDSLAIVHALNINLFEFYLVLSLSYSFWILGLFMGLLKITSMRKETK